MKNVDYYIDQLDILKEYMGYWIEFKDKERVRFEAKIKSEMKSINECIAIVNTAFGDNDTEANISITRQNPFPFKGVIKTFDKLQDKAHKEVKQMIINSIRKFV
jgi:hypothetical protein